MKIFYAGIVTETNTFAPAPTGMANFEEVGIRRGDGSGQVSLFAPCDELLARLAAEGGHELVPGLMAFAQPYGTTMRSVYEQLRDELLAGLRAALPVHAVILPLHGAMVAEGYPDCEGDLIERVRSIVGPEVPIGVELDLHCHFTEQMRTQADVIVAFKEYPHTDINDRLAELWALTLATAERRIRPVTAVHDCRMVGLWHTTRQPMQAFVQRMKDLEGRDGILSVSFGHGFAYGDVPESGAKVWVVADGLLPAAQVKAQALAEQLGCELVDMREATRVRQLSIDAALDRVLAAPLGKPLVLADTADNAGGGAAGDATFILRRLLDRGIGNVALGAFWDLGAVRICTDAGVGAVLRLRMGGKCGPTSGDPVDLRVTVRAIKAEHAQSGLSGSTMDCGPSVWVSTEDGIDLVLISLRTQVFGPNLFTGLGIDLTSKRAVVVKSSQHFHALFAPLAAEVLYVNTPGLMRADYENIPYQHRDGNYWPRVADPWKQTGGAPGGAARG
jgi:microcystin degradation protein MlrC